MEEALTPEQQQSQSRMVKEMHHALIGDPLDPTKPGMVAIQMQMHEDLYGSERRKTPGIKDTLKSVGDRVQLLWEDRLKMIAYCTAASAVVAFLAWVIPLIFKK